MLFGKKQKKEGTAAKKAKPAKETTKSIGDRGEEIAANYLQKIGYQILCRNYRTIYGEIDIIAESAGVTYFVEVKSRQYIGLIPPSASVDERKRYQISRTAQHWFQEQGKETDSTLLIAEVYLTNGDVLLYEDFLK